jgi:isorenieratene synthase
MRPLFSVSLEERRVYLGERPGGEAVSAPAGDDWVQANPRRIERALAHALAKPSGGWYAVDATRSIGERPRAYGVAGRQVVLWRDEGRIHAAPEACPHMGASLAGAQVCDGAVICPWHGLRLGPEGHGRWGHLQVHDDGVLAWIRLGGEAATDQPILAPRPARFLDGVVRIEADCEPRDVLANRLDPWHGAHFHPYSFAGLTVTDADDDVLKMRVVYRIAGPVCIEVDVSFHCPDSRTIVMTILRGDGAGSVVETHATPIGPGRTAIIEATLATSDRTSFQHALRVRDLARPFIERAARRLWVDDAAYAERLHWLRQRKSPPPGMRVVEGR